MKNKKTTVQKVLKRIGKYRFYLLFSLLLALCSVALTLYLPILFGNAIDSIIAARRVELSAVFSVLWKAGVLVFITAVLQWLMNNVNNRISYHVIRDLRIEAFERIQRLPLSYLDSQRNGQIVSNVIADVDQVADGLLIGFTQVFTGVLTILGTLGFMVRLNPLIAAAVVVLTPISLLVAMFIAKRSYKMFRLQSETRGEQTALIDETVAGQKVVIAFGRQAKNEEKFDEINRRLNACSLKATFFSSLTNPSTRFVNSLVYAVVALIGAFSAISGGLSVGALSCFLSYANQYTKPFNEISGVVTELQNALACADRVFELIDQPTESADPQKALSSVDGRVDLSDVCFSYEPLRPLIQNLNLSVKNGQKIAIVGPTGCGKTTVINLLMRFYDVDDGSIAVSAADIRTVSRHSLRRCYGMVLQETWLRSGTVRQNLCMGKPDATEAEMIEASKAAFAHDFISKLPQGYDTVIAEDGGNFSAGQKQLLCIARIMLCKPPMLILDEATSSIDTRTEMKIQAAFEKLMQSRTTFIVAHRLSTIRTADRILVMRDGQIIEQGKHEELLQAGGFYAELYNSQFAGA